MRRICGSSSMRTCQESLSWTAGFVRCCCRTAPSWTATTPSSVSTTCSPMNSFPGVHQSVHSARCSMPSSLSGTFTPRRWYWDVYAPQVRAAQQLSNDRIAQLNGPHHVLVAQTLYDMVIHGVHPSDNANANTISQPDTTTGSVISLPPPDRNAYVERHGMFLVCGEWGTKCKADGTVPESKLIQFCLCAPKVSCMLLILYPVTVQVYWRPSGNTSRPSATSFMSIPGTSSAGVQIPPTGRRRSTPTSGSANRSNSRPGIQTSALHV